MKKSLVKLLILISIGIIYVGCGNSESESQVDNSSRGTAFLGNLANANVSIYEFDSGGLTKTLKWSEKTSNGDTLDKIGKFNTHSKELDKNKLYLYEVTGGIDFDSDDDGVKDTSGSENNGTIRALVKGSIVDTIGDNFSVNYLTEYIFQNIKDSIGNDDLEEKEQSLLADIFDSNKSDKKDIFKYIPSQNKEKLKENFKDKVVPSLVQGIKSGNKQILGDIVKLNSATIVQDKIGLNSTINVKLDINTTVPMNDIMVVAYLDDGTELPITMLGKITPETSEYNVEIDVVEDNEDNVSGTNISTGTHSLVISLNGLDNNISTNSFEVTNDTLAKIDGMDVSDDEEEDDSVSGLGRILSRTTSSKPKIRLPYNDGNITIRSSLHVKNPYLDKNISNLKISSSIKVAGDTIALPMEQLSYLDNNNSDENVLTMPIPTIYADSIRNISLNLLISKDKLTTIITNILPSLVTNQNDLFDATIILNLKTDNDDIIDTYEYPLSLFLDRKVVLLLQQNLTKLLSGSITIEDLLNQVSDGNTGGLSRVLKRGLIDKKGIKKVDYSRSFKAYNYGRRFGSGIYGKGRAWLDTDGIHMTTYLSTKAKIFKKFRMIRFDFTADVAPGSFDDTGYDLGISVLNGQNIYAKSGSMADIIPSYAHSKKNNSSDNNTSSSSDNNTSSSSDNNTSSSSDNNTSSSSDNNTSSEDNNLTTSVDTNSSAYKEAIKASNMNDANETITDLNDAGHPTLLGYQDDFSQDVTVSYSQTFFIGVIPLYMESGASADIGVDAGLGLSGITSMTGYVMPKAYVDAFVEAGLGSGFKIFKKIGVDFRAGIKGTMYLATEKFKNQVDASLNFKGNDEYITNIIGSMHESIKNTFKGPSTDVRTFTAYYGPSKYRIKKVIKGDWWWTAIFKHWDSRYYERTLTSWSSYKHTKTILDKHQNLFDIPLGTDLSADSPDPIIQQNINSDKNILFAHGLLATKNTWNTYANYATDKGWHVFRTNVSKDGSIQTRAKELAEYINTLNIADSSLTAVGHSMGGLDLRYIVSRANEDQAEPYYSAAKKIRKIYTLATPHKGNMFGGLDTSSDAYHDLGKNQMAQFNKEFPYSTLEVDGMKKPLIALRFVCGNLKSFGTDGVVSITNQSLDGASFKLIPIIGEHTNSAILCKGSGAVEELKNTDILDNILNDNYGTKAKTDSLLTHRDIVFYDDYHCEGKEVGSFNSLYDNDIDCSESNKCLDDSAKSVMLYPNVKKGKIIKIFASASGSTKYDDMIIKRNTQDLQEPVCISGFEHLSTSNGIEATFNNNGSSEKYLTGKVSHITIYEVN